MFSSLTTYIVPEITIPWLLDTCRLFQCATLLSRRVQHTSFMDLNLPISMAQMPVPVPISNIRRGS